MSIAATAPTYTKSSSAAHVGAWIATRLNEVLVPLTSSSMYVTAAVVEASGQGFRFSLAGHWPMLHLHDGGRTVDEVTVANLPLGFFAGQSYTTAPLNVSTRRSAGANHGWFRGGFRSERS
jgi:stage II sporulation SpoE-like protein